MLWSARDLLELLWPVSSDHGCEMHIDGQAMHLGPLQWEATVDRLESQQRQVLVQTLLSVRAPAHSRSRLTHGTSSTSRAPPYAARFAAKGSGLAFATGQATFPGNATGHSSFTSTRHG